MSIEDFYEDVAIEQVPFNEKVECIWESAVREGNRIKDVHILGFTSKNKKNGRNYGYAEEAVKEAVPLYEGMDVYVNHNRKGADRDVQDKIGFLEGIYFKDGVGLKGDLVLNESHSFYKPLTWWVDNNPSKVGLSHHAGGVFNRTSGLCESISVVKSVDLVHKPATTQGLFESFSEGVVEDRINEDKVRERFHNIISKATLMLDEQNYNYEEAIQARASTVRRIAEDLASLMGDFEGGNPTLNPDNTQESQEEEDMNWEEITLESLSEHREDLVSVIRKDERALVAARRQKFTESVKDIPEALVTELFEEQCMEVIDDDDKLSRLIEDRKSLVVKHKKPSSKPPTVDVQESHNDGDEIDVDAALAKYKKESN